METVSVCAAAERIRFGLRKSSARKKILTKHLDIVPVLGNSLWLVPKKEFAFGITVRFFAEFSLVSFLVAECAVPIPPYEVGLYIDHSG